MSVKYENNVQTLPTQLQYNFEKGQKMNFLAPELAKITITEGQTLSKNLEFPRHLYAFRDETEPKNRLKAQRNAQKLPTRFQNNFEKVEKTTFLKPKMDKTEPSKSKRQHLANFRSKTSLLGIIYKPFELKIHP